MIAIWPAAPSEARDLSIELAKKHIEGIIPVCVPDLFEWLESAADSFLLFHELHFVLKPVSIDDLSLWRSAGRYLPGKIPRVGDKETKRQTLIALQRAGFDTQDFSQQVARFEVASLRDCIARFGRELDLPTLYGNATRQPFVKLKSSFFRLVTCCNDWSSSEPVYVRLQPHRFREHRARLIAALSI